MENIETIIEAYRRGDSEHRLSLFLQHRDFRDRFMEIDRSDFPAKVDMRAPVVGGSRSNRWRRIFG